MTTPQHAGDPTRVVVVAGSGRSGTSTIAGVLKLVGLRIPPPEIPGNRTNPRGFFEPKWAVELQTRLLRRASVVLTDSRPGAFADAGRVADDRVRRQVAEWIREHTADGSELVVKDPRNSWFLPLWKDAASDAGAEVRYLTMLRHPAEVVGSKDKYYRGLNAGETMRHAQTTRVASWLNVALFTEAVTRDSPRTFVLYNDLLEDWRAVLSRVVAELGLRSGRELPDDVAAEVDEFVDPGLRRVRTGWDDIDCPDEVRGLAQEVWERLCDLAVRGGFDESAQLRLDEIRDRYVELYADAEALAQSSADRARRIGSRQGRKKAFRELRARDRTATSKRVRRVMPVRARRTAARLAHRIRQGRRG